MSQENIAKQIFDFIGEFTFQHGEKFTSIFHFSEFLQKEILNEFGEFLKEKPVNDSQENTITNGPTTPYDKITYYSGENLKKSTTIISEKKRKYKNKQEEQNLKNAESYLNGTYEPKPKEEPVKKRRGCVPGVKRGPYKKIKLSIPAEEQTEQPEQPEEKKRTKKPYQRIGHYVPRYKQPDTEGFSSDVQISGPGVPDISLPQNDPEKILNDKGEYPEEER